jgi:hypothetical protein
MIHKYNIKNAPISVTQNDVNFYIAKCNTDPVYLLNKNSLDDLIVKYPNSTDLIGLRIKSICINECYSTRINSKDLIPLARWICSIKNVDSKIKSGDASIVNEIAASCSIGGVTTKDVYSFASKYCHFHNPDQFPIFDSFVHDMLCQLQNEQDFYRIQTGERRKFTQADLKNYSKFKKIRRAFVDYFKLGSYTVLDIDKFLWRAGRDTYFNEET